MAVSVSVLASSIGGLVGSAYSGFCEEYSTNSLPKLWPCADCYSWLSLDGRRPVYCYLLPFSIAGSIGVAVSTTIPQLLVCRFFQAFGVSSGLSVGSGVIGDIYKLEERGTAMGVFFAVRDILSLASHKIDSADVWDRHRGFY